MSRESQTAQHKSLMASLEEASGFHLLGSKLFEGQSVPSTEPTLRHEILGRALEEASGYPTLEFPEQAPVRFDTLPIYQDFNSFAARGVFVAKVDKVPQSLAVVVDTLIGIISENKDEFFDSLMAEDYQRLDTVRGKLIGIVGKDKNHLLAPLLDFVNNLIKNHGEESNLSTRERYRPAPRSERVGRPANRPRVKLADLLPQEPEILENIQDANAAVLKPRRSERVGRPANRPRVKLADLLAREAKRIEAEESDTETPVGSEVW